MAISAVIAAYNSAPYLERVVRNVRGFDEVVVCDLGSTDNTAALAEKLGCRVVSFVRKPGEKIAAFRNRAIRTASHEWVLMVRLNELVTKELRDYLYDFIKDPGDVRAIYVPRKNFIMNRQDTTKYPDFQLRFVHKEHASWGEGSESEPDVKGAVRKISATRDELALLKVPDRFEEVITTAVATFEGEERYSSPSKVSLIKIFGRPWARFVNDFFFKGKIRYGVAGYISAMNEAIAEYYVIGRGHEDALMEEFYKDLDKRGM